LLKGVRIKTETTRTIRASKGIAMTISRLDLRLDQEIKTKAEKLPMEQLEHLFA